MKPPSCVVDRWKPDSTAEILSQSPGQSNLVNSGLEASTFYPDTFLLSVPFYLLLCLFIFVLRTRDSNLQ